MPPSDPVVGYDTSADQQDYTVCVGECADDPMFEGSEFEPIYASQAGDSFCDLCSKPLG